MTLKELLAVLPPTGLGSLAFPQRLLGAFRRKTITFCNGQTDETTPVYWFQSRSFTIDLRLPAGPATPPAERQGWVGDTHWDSRASQMSWTIARSYQPSNQWPEAATLAFIGNAVLEFAPSGAYVEDWRQQSSSGPLLGLRLIGLEDRTTGEVHAMDGGLIVAGEHIAFARSRLPADDAAIRERGDLAEALAAGTATLPQVESFEVSLALHGAAITHSTQPYRIGTQIAASDFLIGAAGDIILSRDDQLLRFVLDVFEPFLVFTSETPATSEAQLWLEAEKSHLLRNAAVAR